jgi:Golgi nucleoside diphosphatase
MQNQSVDKCKEISQFIAHEKEIQTKLANLKFMKMILDASTTNPVGKWKSIDRCVQN